MTLPVPAYVQIDGLRSSSIRYRWDDWDVEAVDCPVDETVHERLNSMSQRAVAAFAIAACEWVVYRFSNLVSDARLRQYLEAAWAQVCDFRYATHFDIDVDQWQGPVRGPLGVSIRRVKFAIRKAEVEADAAWSAARLSKLVEHVLPDSAAYITWRDCVIDRFVRLYPFDVDESLGDPVPWQFADPACDARIEDAERLLNDFLRGLNPNDNPFLNPPDIMVAQGFAGQPYTFNLREDRRRRFEW
jgi:hypothetical protein